VAESKKILLIEDEAFISDMYKIVFTKEGFVVETASDGEEGLAKAQAGDYDLILLDIMLPKMNGLDALKEMRKEGSSAKKTPVFLLTNLGQENIIKQAFKIGAQGYFMKANLLPQQIVSEVRDFFKEKDKGLR